MKRGLFFLAFAATACQAAPTRTVFENGLRLITEPEQGSQWVVVTAFVTAGADTDGDRPGARYVTAQAAYQRHANLSQNSLDQVAANIGGGLRLFFDRDVIRYETLTTAPWVDNALFLTVGALKNGEFAAEEVADAKKAVEPLLRLPASPSAFGVYHLVKNCFDDSPLIRLPSQDEIDQVTVSDCQNYYERYFSPQRITIVVAGAIDQMAVINSLRKSIGSWKPDKAVRQVPMSPVTMAESFDKVRSTNTVSAYSFSGYVGPPPSSPDFPAFAVFASALGKGQASRVVRAFRDTGRAYQVGTGLYPTAAGTVAYTWAQFNPIEFNPARGKMDIYLADSITLLKKTARAMIDDGLKGEELDRAKRVLEVGYYLDDAQSSGGIVPFQTGHQRIRDRAYWLGWWEAVGGGFEMDGRFPELVEAVTADSVAAVAMKYCTKVGTVLVIPVEP